MRWKDIHFLMHILTFGERKKGFCFTWGSFSVIWCIAHFGHFLGKKSYLGQFHLLVFLMKRRSGVEEMASWPQPILFFNNTLLFLEATGRSCHFVLHLICIPISMALLHKVPVFQGSLPILWNQTGQPPNFHLVHRAHKLGDMHSIDVNALENSEQIPFYFKMSFALRGFLFPRKLEQRGHTKVGNKTLQCFWYLKSKASAFPAFFWW